jgi:hypothetical protein
MVTWRGLTQLHVLRWWWSWGRKRERWEKMGEFIMRNWDLRELCARVNLPSLLWQVWVQISGVTTLIRGLSNPIRQVVHQLSHICPHPPHRSHLHSSALILIHYSTIATQDKVKPFHSISRCHDYELIQSTAYTKYSIHQAQHTPSTARTKYGIHRWLFVLQSFWWLLCDSLM